MSSEEVTLARRLRRISLRKADVDRVLKSVQGAGLRVAGVEVRADGSFNIVTSEGGPRQAEGFAEWRGQRAKRSAKGA
jgi:hypothetical protein